MTEHTPGPWNTDPSVGEDIVHGNDGSVVALVQGEQSQANANAHLIAAAPDLLEALQECLREHGGFTIKGECERKAYAAISKARGET